MSSMSKSVDAIAIDDPVFTELMNEFYALAGFQSGDMAVSVKNFQIALKALKKKLKPDVAGGSAFSKICMNRQENILIVGSLGVINFQLKLILGRLNFSVTIVSTVEEALEEFQNKDYRTVIIDLFMPTEREGFMVLDELKKMAIMANMNFKVILLANLSRRKKLEQDSLARGADKFLVRDEGWQKRLVDYLAERFEDE